MTYTVEEVRRVLTYEMHMRDELRSIARRIAKHRNPRNGTKIYAWILVSGIDAAGTEAHVQVGPYLGTYADTDEHEGRIIRCYPLDPAHQQWALSTLAAYLYGYLLDHNLTVRVGFREISKDGSVADHCAAASTVLVSSPSGDYRQFVVQEEHEAP